MPVVDLKSDPLLQQPHSLRTYEDQPKWSNCEKTFMLIHCNFGWSINSLHGRNGRESRLCFGVFLPNLSILCHGVVLTCQCAHINTAYMSFTLTCQHFTQQAPRWANVWTESRCFRETFPSGRDVYFIIHWLQRTRRCETILNSFSVPHLILIITLLIDKIKLRLVWEYKFSHPAPHFRTPEHKSQ